MSIFGLKEKKLEEVVEEEDYTEEDEGDNEELFGLSDFLPSCPTCKQGIRQLHWRCIPVDNGGGNDEQVLTCSKCGAILKFL